MLGVVLPSISRVFVSPIRGGGTWIERPEYEPEQARVSDETNLSMMRLAASRSHRSPRMDKVVEAFGRREEVLRGSVGIKVGLIVEQQCDLYVHLSPRTKQWDTCAPEVILQEQVDALLTSLDDHYAITKRKCETAMGCSQHGVAHDKIILHAHALMSQLDGLQPINSSRSLPNGCLFLKGTHAMR